jgi:hypothetical protein
VTVLGKDPAFRRG